MTNIIILAGLLYILLGIWILKVAHKAMKKDTDDPTLLEIREEYNSFSRFGKIVVDVSAILFSPILVIIAFVIPSLRK